jgi:hypothetical protein
MKLGLKVLGMLGGLLICFERERGRMLFEESVVVRLTMMGLCLGGPSWMSIG